MFKCDLSKFPSLSSSRWLVGFPVPRAHHPHVPGEMKQPGSRGTTRLHLAVSPKNAAYTALSADLCTPCPSTRPCSWRGSARTAPRGEAGPSSGFPALRQAQACTPGAFPDPETASLCSWEKAAGEVRLPTATHPANQCELPPKPGSLESQLCGQRLPNRAEPPFPCKGTTSLPRKISLFILLGSPQAHGQEGWQRVGSAESRRLPRSVCGCGEGPHPGR